jgi:glutaredoxin
MTGGEPPRPAHTDADVTLYRLQACPYCERVVQTLDRLGVDYHSRFVEPMHSDRDVVRRLTGKREVPVIVDDNTGVTMGESATIVKYLHKTYGNRGGDE